MTCTPSSTVADLSRRMTRRDLLTERQQDLLDCLADGKSNADIAAALELPLETVKSDVREILAKLGVSSVAEAVEATHPGPATRFICWLRGHVLVVSVLAFLVATAGVAWLALGGTDAESASDDHLRVLIADVLYPEPGVRIIDLPEGRDRVYLEDVGKIVVAYWSPTGEHLWGFIDDSEDGDVGPEDDDSGSEPRVRRSVLMSYPSGAYTVIESAPDEPDATPRWSPDGTRFVFLTDRFRLYSSDGELLAEHSADALGIELHASTFSEGDWWSADSERLLVANHFPTRTMDRDGNLFGPFDAGIVDAADIVDSEVTWRSDGVGLDAWIFERDSGERIGYSLDLLGEPVAVSQLSSEALDEMFADFVARRLPPPELLADIEANAPEGWEAVEDVERGHWGWAVSFQREDRARGEPETYRTLIRVGDIDYQYDGNRELRRGSPGGVLVLGPPAPPLIVPDSDIEGCPVHESRCLVASHQLELLLAGNVDQVMEFSAGGPYPCWGSSGHQRANPGTAEVCEGSTSSVGRFAYRLNDGGGEQRFVSVFEFRVFLSSLASRMGAANTDAGDDFSSGEPAIIGFTTLRREDPPGTTVYANISWLEGVEDVAQREVVALELGHRGISGAVVRGSDTGYDLALTGGKAPGPTREETSVEAVLWRH